MTREEILSFNRQLNDLEGDYVKLQQENQELNKQIEDLFSENSKLRKKLENSMTFQDYEYTLNKKIQLENQQKEFIWYLEKEIVDSRAGSGQQYYAQQHLKLYKEIIGVKDE